MEGGCSNQPDRRFLPELTWNLAGAAGRYRIRYYLSRDRSEEVKSIDARIGEY